MASLPKNNVVDVTNYVMHDLGQPLHAFDADRISGNEIIVQTLPAGTKFTTLDEIERELHEEDLMICDAEKPLAIAGVFGGIGSGVNSGTTKLFIESAYFNPVTVRKTAKRHGLIQMPLLDMKEESIQILQIMLLKELFCSFRNWQAEVLPVT